MRQNLAQIDAIFAAERAFLLVGDLTIEQSGVDPLGLRQLNLDLMDATVPGINNVTMHIRPYAFMAWAWWRSWQLTDPDGSCDSVELADRVMRYEAMFAWAHALAERPLIGATAIGRHLPRKGEDRRFRFEGKRWQALKDELTSIMAPTQYGPSIKANRWLRPMEGGGFRATKETMAAVAAIEDKVSRHLPQRLFGREAPEVSCSDVLPFAEYLRVDETTQEERDGFRLLFRDGADRQDAPRDLRRRKATINLIRAHLLGAGRPLAVHEIRRVLAKAALPAGYADDDPETAVSVALLSILQARQLQRLATEAMLFWTEASLGRDRMHAQTSDQLALKADAAARHDDPLALAATTVGGYLDFVEHLGMAVGWPAAAAEPGTDVVALVEKLIRAQRKGDGAVLPGLCLKSFAVVRAISRGLRRQGVPRAAGNPLDGRPDRLPFGSLERQLDGLSDRPLVELWRQVIENWVIGQHVHWSAVRGGDGKKRLRIALDDGGWIRVRKSASGWFRPTEDRLLTMLSLGSECGLFMREGMPPCFSATTDPVSATNQTISSPEPEGR
ncbi:MAG: hypothetical protein BGP12_20295 [Rhodospirillales bacterium 70-18]|nr:hypothetical protein [Rhodospirillales bacterium]OJY74346.1 MAG: hypothetical protein BGP12_20295 [Rhodospirillales bacterium 70-18]